MGNEIEIHGIIFFDHSFERQVSENDFEIVCEYSANIELTLDCEILNEKKRFIIQVGGNNEEDFEANIPDSSANLCKLFDQDFASENFSASKIWSLLEKQHGLENNYNFLKNIGETLETI